MGLVYGEGFDLFILDEAPRELQLADARDLFSGDGLDSCCKFIERDLTCFF